MNLQQALLSGVGLSHVRIGDALQPACVDGRGQSSLRPLPAQAFQVGELPCGHPGLPQDGGLVLCACLFRRPDERVRAPLDPTAEGRCPEAQEGVERQRYDGNLRTGHPSAVPAVSGLCFGCFVCLARELGTFNPSEYAHMHVKVESLTFGRGSEASQGMA